jgi:hypothetical protein
MADIYYSSGNVGIGTTLPGQRLSVAGMIESTSGGLKYPDGTTQTTSTIAVIKVDGLSPSAPCNGSFTTVAICPAGYTVSGCSAWTGNFANPAGAWKSGNGCQGGCGGGGNNDIGVQAICIKLQ